MQPTTSASSGLSTDSPNARCSRISGAGEMADLVRAFDWSASSLGPMETWPESLLTAVSIVLGSRHPLVVWWGQDLIQFYNDAYRPSLGRDKHPKALGQRAQDCWREVWASIGPQIDSVLQRGESTWNVDQYLPIYRNGNQLEDAWWTFSYSPIRDRTGDIAGIFVVVSETTDRVRSERELHRSSERLQLALEAADLGTWYYSPMDGTFTADAHMQRIFGAPDPTGDHDFWQRLLHPDDRRAAREEFAAALAGLRTYHLEYRVLHPSGVRWIRSKGKVLEAEDGTKSMFAIVEDITERKLAEIELHQRARDLRESERIGKMGSWRLVLATGELTWSEEVYRLLEHDPSLPVLNFAERPEIMEPDSLRRLEAAVAQCIATGQAYELDTKMYLPSNGKVVWFATRGEPVFDSQSRVVELRGTVRDITDRKLTEEALRDSEERLRLALSAARDMGSFDWDIQLDRCIADARFCTIFGLDPELGKRGLPMAEALANTHPEDWPEVERLARRTMDTGEDFIKDYRVQTTPNTLRWVSARGTCLRSNDGTPVRFTGVILDITERKVTEQALLRTEKLAAVGRLAASIAHEINNPLASVTNLLYLAKLSAVDTNALEYLGMAEQELRRASAITTQTLRFHRQSSRPTEVTCDDLIVSVLGILRSRLLNANVTVEMRKRTNGPVLCFDGEIRQVIYNLLVNAVDAMQQRGGRLLLRSREGRNCTTGRPGLILTIADTGDGMSSETLTKIFEPFYSTKGVAGTGLGLWISKEIIDRHHGQLRVRSSQRASHSGTVFTIFLPSDSAIA